VAEGLSETAMLDTMKNIEMLIAEGGEITIGTIASDICAATATDDTNALAMLVRRDGESLDDLLERLDKAIGLAWSDDLFIDEVNDGESELL
jgi:hypothetical protein